MACAVRAMRGMELSRGSVLSRRAASQPSSSGRLMSIRIRSGDSLAAISSPWRPSTATRTRYPRRSSRRRSMSRFISLSSTSRILRFSALMSSASRGNVRAQQVSNHFQNLRLGVRPLLHDPLDRVVEAPVVLLGELFGGNHDDRNPLPLSPSPEVLDELESIHLGHHQVEQ